MLPKVESHSGRPFAAVFMLLAGLATGGSCAEHRLDLGAACLKDEDCLSGVCAAQECAPASAIADGGEFGDVVVSAQSDSGIGSEPGPDAAVDATEEPSPDSSVDGNSDAGVGANAADAQSDALVDVVDAASTPRPDAAADATLDSGDAGTVADGAPDVSLDVVGESGPDGGSDSGSPG